MTHKYNGGKFKWVETVAHVWRGTRRDRQRDTCRLPSPVARCEPLLTPLTVTLLLPSSPTPSFFQIPDAAAAEMVIVVIGDIMEYREVEAEEHLRVTCWSTHLFCDNCTASWRSPEHLDASHTDKFQSKLRRKVPPGEAENPLAQLSLHPSQVRNYRTRSVSSSSSLIPSSPPP